MTREKLEVDGETMAKVNAFKYIGAIKTSMGSCSEDIKARIGRAKKATMKLDEIGESAHMASHYIRSRRVDFIKKNDERRLEAAEMWCYRRMLRISWTEKRTNKSILDELQTRRELLAQIIKSKMAFFGQACRSNKCNLVKTCILGMMSGKRRRGAQDAMH